MSSKLHRIRSELRDARAKFVEMERGNKMSYSGEEDWYGEEEYHLPEMSVSAGINQYVDYIESVCSTDTDDTTGAIVELPARPASPAAAEEGTQLYGFSLDTENYTKVIYKKSGINKFHFSDDFYEAFCEKYNTFDLKKADLDTNLVYRYDHRVVSFVEEYSCKKSAGENVVIGIKYIRTNMLDCVEFYEAQINEVICFDFNYKYRVILEMIMKNSYLVYSDVKLYEEVKMLEKLYNRGEMDIFILDIDDDCL